MTPTDTTSRWPATSATAPAPARSSKKCGTLTLSGVNSYTGGTSVLAGAVVMASPGAASSRGIVSVGAGGLVVLGATTVTSTSTAAKTSTATTATETNSQTVATANTATTTSTTTAADTTTVAAATSLPVSRSKSPVSVDGSGGQTAAKVEGTNGHRHVAFAAARLSASTTSVARTTATASTTISDGGVVAFEDHARAHDVVLQSRLVGSSGIEASDAAGSVHSGGKLHPAKNRGPIEGLVDAALVALVV